MSNPTASITQDEISSQTLRENVSKLPPEVKARLMREAKAAHRVSQVAYQKTYHQLFSDGYAVQPAIGKTGGVDNVGWELLAPSKGGPDWYLATRELCLQEVPRHKSLYARVNRG